MKTISVALKAHNALETTTLCTLLKITRADSTVFGFTDSDHDITYLGIPYLAASSYSQSAISTSAALDVDNMEVTGILNSSLILESDLLAGKWDYAAVEIMRVNYKDLTMGHEMMRVGTLGNVKTGKANFIAELRGKTQALQQFLGRVYMPSCDADLGDTRCSINLASWTSTGAVTSSSSTNSFTDSARAEATGYFSFGLLTFTSGANAGFKSEVKGFSVGGVFTLQLSAPNTISVGDGYSVHAGCDKLRTTCASKFSNAVNFRGFPDLPGLDRYQSGL